MSALFIITLVLALGGAAAALTAALGKMRGFISQAWAGRINTLAYVLMGLSVLSFVLRGLIGPGQAGP